jgi:hypothetical protein
MTFFNHVAARAPISSSDFAQQTLIRVGGTTSVTIVIASATTVFVPRRTVFASGTNVFALGTNVFAPHTNAFSSAADVCAGAPTCTQVGEGLVGSLDDSNDPVGHYIPQL